MPVGYTGFGPSWPLLSHVALHSERASAVYLQQPLIRACCAMWHCTQSLHPYASVPHHSVLCVPSANRGPLHGVSTGRCCRTLELFRGSLLPACCSAKHPMCLAHSSHASPWLQTWPTVRPHNGMRATAIVCPLWMCLCLNTCGMSP